MNLVFSSKGFIVHYQDDNKENKTICGCDIAKADIPQEQIIDALNDTKSPYLKIRMCKVCEQIEEQCRI